MNSTQSTHFEGNESGSEQPRTDKRGRVWVSKGRREELLDEFERSHLSAAAFARLAGVHYATFANWRQKRRQQRRAQENGAAPDRLAASGRPLPLLEAYVEDGAAAGGAAPLIVDLPGKARLRVDCASQLRLAAELLALLSQTTRL